VVDLLEEPFNPHIPPVQMDPLAKTQGQYHIKLWALTFSASIILRNVVTLAAEYNNAT